MAKIDFQAIAVQVARSKAFKKEALKAAKAIVLAEQKKLIQDFNKHIVTKELEAGPTSSNISKTLDGLSANHGGNLFSFIGFFEGDNPTEAIRQVLKQGVNILDTQALYTRFTKGGGITVGFRVNTLNIDDFEDVVEYPDGYSAGNLLKDLETGNIRGLSHYIYDEEFGSYESRSGTGLQAKKGGKMITIRDGDTNNAIPYISELLDDFADRLRAAV